MSQMETKSFTVSAVIPAYNAAEYLGRTIDSVVAQSRAADEIIIVDDGSTDNTADVAGAYGEKVKYIHQENAGASVARNAGINAASCEWIATYATEKSLCTNAHVRQANANATNISWPSAAVRPTAIMASLFRCAPISGNTP